MKQDDLISLVSLRARLYSDGERELAALLGRVIDESQMDYQSLIEDLFTAMRAESAFRRASEAPADVVVTAARFQHEWPHLSAAVDALMRTSVTREFPFVNLV